MKQYRASIILATYCPDQPRYELCKRSFAEIHNTGIPREDYQLIVIDNGGIHKDLIAQLGADIIVWNKVNLGQGGGLNEGSALAASSNLAFIDDDLSYRSGWLYEGVRLIERHSSMVGCLKDLSRIKAKYFVGKTKSGNPIYRKVGGVWIMKRQIFNLYGPFSAGYYSFGGLFTRVLIRNKVNFVGGKEPYIFQLGEKKSVKGGIPTYEKHAEWLKKHYKRENKNDYS